MERLKSAKKALDGSQYDTAVNICQEILAGDRTNYMALIFLGAALNEMNLDPRDAFRRAIEVKPKGPLAYQGLLKYYKRNPAANLQGLLDANVALYRLGAVEHAALCNTLGEVAHQFDALEICGRILYDLHLKETDDENKKRNIQVFKMILSDKTPTTLDDQFDLLEEIFNCTNLTELSHSFFVKYFHCAIRAKNFNFVLEKVSKNPNMPGEILLKEWILNYFFEKKVVEAESFQCATETVLKIVEEVLQVSPTSNVAQLCRVLTLLDDKPLNAYLITLEIIKKAKMDVYLSFLQARCCMELNRWSECEIIVRPLAKSANPSHATCAKKLLLISLCSQCEPDKATEGILLSKSSDFHNDPSLTLALFKSYITLDKLPEAKNLIEALKSTSYYTYAMAIIFNKEGNTDKAISLLEENANGYLNLLQLGMFYMDDKNEYKKASSFLLQSAKCNPYQFTTFLYLGNFYMSHDKNLEKAKKCFVKTIELNPECLEAAKRLSIVYSETKDWESNFGLLHSIINSVVLDNRHRFQWVWLRLGLHHIAQKEWDDAIVNLRTYMRLNSLDPAAWIILADSYYNRGSYTSALKCYQRAVEIDPNGKHCLIQIGTIQCLLMQYNEALITFETVSDDYLLPALKGSAEVKLCQAKDLYSKSLYDACREHAQEAIDIACRALKLQELNCFWQIMYNSMLTITKLPQKCKYVDFNPDFLLNEDIKTNKYSANEIFKIAIDCIQKTIIISDDPKHHLYYDLALAYYDFHVQSSNKTYAEEAVMTIEKCLEAEKERWQHWNLFGLVCSSNAISRYADAQHAFLKGLELDSANSVLWSNLGMLYCIIGEFKIANVLFRKAQESDPTYVKSWIGQSMIADMTDHDAEAIDLSRHASQLGFDIESSSKYGYWVAKTLCLQDENEEIGKHLRGSGHAVMSASDLMSINCEFDEVDGWNLNVYGLLLEKSGRYDCAMKLFQQALEKVGRDYQDKVLSNLGRLHCLLKDYTKAIEILSQITEFDINSACVLAFAYFKSGKYHDSYLTYRRAMEWLANEDGDKIDLLVGMGCVLALNGESEDARLLLHQAIDMDHENPSITGLLTICAVALKTEQPHVAQMVINELKSNRSANRVVVIILETYLIYKHKSSKEAMRYVVKIIRRSPQNPLLWHLLSWICGDNTRLINLCTKKTIAYGQPKDFKFSLFLACLTELLIGESSRGRVLAQKALMMDPGSGSNWALMAYALRKSKPGSSTDAWLAKANVFVSKNFELDSVFMSWLTGTARSF